MDYFIDVLRFWALNVSVELLSMEGQKALGFHQKYNNLYNEDERRSCRFGMIWGQVINDNYHFGWTIPLTTYKLSKSHSKMYFSN